MKKLGLVLVLLWSAMALPAWAQTPVKPCFPTGDSSASGATLKTCQDVTTSNPFPVAGTVTPSNTTTTPLPVETQGTPGVVVGVGTGTTAAVTATLAGAVGKTTFICGFTITSGATAATNGAATITGLTGASTFTYNQAVGTATAPVKTTDTFNPCLPASATNTAIVVTSAAAGTAGVTDVNAWGFQQ